jgi:hypothetical protein
MQNVFGFAHADWIVFFSFVKREMRLETFEWVLHNSVERYRQAISDPNVRLIDVPDKILGTCAKAVKVYHFGKSIAAAKASQ